MAIRYYDKTNQPGSELFAATPIDHLRYEPLVFVNHIPLDDANVFWSPVPAGQQLTYNVANIPDGLEPIPAPTAAEQARFDLAAAGVNATTVTIAMLADHRSIPGLLAAIDAAIDLVVISSGLTLAQVTELI